MGFLFKKMPDKCFYNDVIVSNGLKRLRDMFVGDVCNTLDINPKHCQYFEVYIFNHNMPNEKGILKADFSERFNDRVRAVLGPDLIDVMEPEETKKAKSLLPDIESQVNSKIKTLKGKNAPEFKIINATGVLKNISCHFNYVYWFVQIDYEMTDGFKESIVYPQDNPKYLEWSALTERPDFLPWALEQAKNEL